MEDGRKLGRDRIRLATAGVGAEAFSGSSVALLGVDEAVAPVDRAVGQELIGVNLRGRPACQMGVSA